MSNGAAMLLIVSNVFITVSFGAPYYSVFDSCIAFTLLSLLHSLAVGSDSSRAFGIFSQSCYPVGFGFGVGLSICESIGKSVFQNCTI
jgi:hypothetical protein